MPTAREVADLQAAAATLREEIARGEGTLKQLKKNVTVLEDAQGVATRIAHLRNEIAKLETEYADHYEKYEAAYAAAVEAQGRPR